MLKEDELRGLSEDELYIELGKLHEAEESDEALGLGIGDDAKELGRRIFGAIEGKAFDALCGTGKKGAEVEKILSTARTGGYASTALLVAVLTKLGVSEAQAVVGATLLMKIVLEPAGVELCSFWRERRSP